MKKIILAAITMFATSAFAGDYIYSYPKYDGIDVNNLCDAGKVFRTINPIDVCDSWTEIPPINDEFYPSEWVCNSYHKEDVTVSKTGPTCLEYGHGDHNAADCIKHGTETRPNTVIAERINTHGDAMLSEYFYFTIPACQK